MRWTDPQCIPKPVMRIVRMLWRAAVLRIMVLIDLYIHMDVDLHVLLGDQMLLRLLLAAPV